MTVNNSKQTQGRNASARLLDTVAASVLQRAAALWERADQVKTAIATRRWIAQPRSAQGGTRMARYRNHHAEVRSDPAPASNIKQVAGAQPRVVESGSTPTVAPVRAARVTAADPPSPRSTSATARMDLDLAKGIVMAWKRCNRWQAFDEIFDVARRSHVSPLQLAQELIRVVADAEPTQQSIGNGPVITAQWGRYLPQVSGHDRRIAGPTVPAALLSTGDTSANGKGPNEAYLGH